jgi:hypothetical protein
MIEGTTDQDRRLQVVAWGAALVGWGICLLLYVVEYRAAASAGNGIISVGATSISGLVVGIVAMVCALKLQEDDFSDLGQWVKTIICSVPFFWLVSMLDPLGATARIY